jgi:UDP:flavonoid glycosyltransferase YjiC (YdhE family)
MWRPGNNDFQLTKSSFFDLIIEPGDLAGEADRGPTADLDDANRVPPVTMLEVVPRDTRIEAAAALGLDPDRPTVLVTLGSGRLGSVSEPGRIVVSALLEDPEWQIAVTRAAIAEQHVPIVDRDRIVELHGVYPLVRHLSAFDAVVSAAGYNAVHEFLPAGIPTLLVPNPATRTDDQIGRADHLAGAGLALTAHPDGATELAAGVRRLSHPEVRSALTERLATLEEPARLGGAAATAALLAGLPRRADATPGFTRPPPTRDFQRWKQRLMVVLGPRGTIDVR